MSGMQHLCLSWAMLLWVAVFALPAAANPVPLGAIFTDVHAFDPDAPPLLDCAQIVQHTTEDGWLDFDIYVRNMVYQPPYGVDDCEFAFTWPESWHYDVEWYPIPYSGVGTIDVNGNQAVVSLSYPNCPTTEGELFLLLRCSFLVEGYGALDPLDYEFNISFCNPGGSVDYAPGIGAEAGVICDYEEVGCWLEYSCQPEAETPLLELQANQGETLTADLMFLAYPQVVEPCSPTFEDTEPWMTLSVGDGEEYWEFPVTLEIDTSALAPGEYTGWVKADDRGVACTRVILTVGDLVGVEKQSWSRIKAFY